MEKIKIAVIILADVEPHESFGRVINALEVVKEYKEAGDDVQLIFDGAGAATLAELSKPDSKLHSLYLSVKDKVTGVCDFCATGFAVHESLEACGVVFLNEHNKHPSFRKLSMDGYQILIF